MEASRTCMSRGETKKTALVRRGARSCGCGPSITRCCAACSRPFERICVHQPKSNTASPGLTATSRQTAAPSSAAVASCTWRPAVSAKMSVKEPKSRWARQRSADASSPPDHAFSAPKEDRTREVSSMRRCSGSSKRVLWCSGCDAALFGTHQSSRPFESRSGRQQGWRRCSPRGRQPRAAWGPRALPRHARSRRRR